MTSKIRVGVRIRPVKPGSLIPVSVSKETSSITVSDVNSGRCVSQFPYDFVFGPDETTTAVYTNLAREIVINAVKGFNGTIFAYGQTASGKTHTMIGDSVNPGIVRQALVDIFDTIEKSPDRMFLLRLSILDIYNEVLTDLLDPNSRKLHIRENSDGTVFVENLSEEICTTPDDIIRYLNDGLARRHVGATNMNEYSSRSHSICRLIIESRPRVEEGVVNVSQLNFVDLAGSERVAQTGASGERLKEGQAINKSLFLLTLVISKLSEGQSFVNFRDSKLTRILQNALGGNSLTAIVCTVSPVINFLEQTISTLKFATSASNIATKPILNENVSNEAMMKRMQLEIAELRAKIAQFESLDQREKAKQELAEKEQLFRGAICFSTRGFEEVPKPMPRSRRLTWAPRDRCNFALTITDDDFSAVRTAGPSSAIKRDLESILGRGNDTGESSRRSPVGTVATKRCRRREVIFRLPTEKPIEENADGEAAELDSSSDEEVKNGFVSPTGQNGNEVATDILVDLNEPVVCRSAATSPIIFEPKIVSKATQSEPEGGDDLYSMGREIFLENSVAHFEAREEIVKLECEIRRLEEENSCLKAQIAKESKTECEIRRLEEENLALKNELAKEPVQTKATDCEKCRNSEDELASLNSRYASLKTKYDQVVSALEDERGSQEPSKPVSELETRIADLEKQLQTSQDEKAEMELKLREIQVSENEAKQLVEDLRREKGEIENQLSSIHEQMDRFLQVEPFRNKNSFGPRKSGTTSAATSQQIPVKEPTPKPTSSGVLTGRKRTPVKNPTPKPKPSRVLTGRKKAPANYRKRQSPDTSESEDWSTDSEQPLSASAKPKRKNQHEILEWIQDGNDRINVNQPFSLANYLGRKLEMSRSIPTDCTVRTAQCSIPRPPPPESDDVDANVDAFVDHSNKLFLLDRKHSVVELNHIYFQMGRDVHYVKKHVQGSATKRYWKKYCQENFVFSYQRSWTVLKTFETYKDHEFLMDAFLSFSKLSLLRYNFEKFKNTPEIISLREKYDLWL